MMNYEFKEQDAYDFARHVGIQVRKSGENLHFKTCPYCRSRDKETFAISLKTGQYNCLRNSCGVTGNFFTLARDFGFSLGVDFDNYYTPKKKYRSFKQKEIKPHDKAVEYMLSRGIDEETTRRYEITVQKEHENVIVFPFFDENSSLQFIKYRKTDFDKSKDKSKEWCEANCKPILFGMKQCNNKFDRLIVTEGQCFSGDAEILTDGGWIQFQNYCGQNVLQVNENMSGSFVAPKQFIVKRHIGKMVNVKIGGNYETNTTDDHNLVFLDRKGRVKKIKAIEHIPSCYHIPTAIYIDAEQYKNWTNSMFALYIAISADGTIDVRKNTGWKIAKSERYVRIALCLERKTKRLIEILDELQIEYKNNKDSRGYDSICFPCPDWLTSKFIPYEFATKTSLAQKKFILDEMIKWDGNKVKGRNQYEYNTILKHNADVMQLIATSCGFMSTIMSKKNGGNGLFKNGYIYKVSVLLGKNNVSTQQFEHHKEISDVDMRVYCVTVDTGMILVRQNGKISVSGNCDSMSVASSGIENAVSVPTGAKGFTWVPFCWDWITKFKEIVVFGDFEKGHMSLLDEIKMRFKCIIKVVCEKDYKGCKDANEILQKFGKDAVKQAVENAEMLPMAHIIKASSVKKVDINAIEKCPTGINSIDRILNGGLPFGGLVLVAGKRGDGKSTFANGLICSALNNGYNSMVYSGELTNEHVVSWIDMQLAGPQHAISEQNAFMETYYRIGDDVKNQLSNWYDESLYIYDANSTKRKTEKIDLIKLIDEATSRYGIRVILIDNLMTAITLDPDHNSNKYDKQADFANDLAELARTKNLIIVLVAHRRKSMFASTDENDEVSGASEISNAASVILNYNRGKGSDEEPFPEEDRLVTISKNRLTGKLDLKGHTLHYDDRSKRVYDSYEELTKRYKWEVAEQKFDVYKYEDSCEPSPFDE